MVLTLDPKMFPSASCSIDALRMVIRDRVAGKFCRRLQNKKAIKRLVQFFDARSPQHSSRLRASSKLRFHRTLEFQHGDRCNTGTQATEMAHFHILIDLPDLPQDLIEETWTGIKTTHYGYIVGNVHITPNVDSSWASYVTKPCALPDFAKDMTDRISRFHTSDGFFPCKSSSHRPSEAAGTPAGRAMYPRRALRRTYWQKSTRCANRTRLSRGMVDGFKLLTEHHLYDLPLQAVRAILSLVTGSFIDTAHQKLQFRFSPDRSNQLLYYLRHYEWDFSRDPAATLRNLDSLLAERFGCTTSGWPCRPSGQ
ncbi:MAG TPA: hypothetical protein VHQ47_12140 [Phycisphaerae bacterium]|nr:hypothetical protein [Phycisphaerae bacterium]